MAQFVRIASKDDIPDNGMRAFDIKHNRIVICRTDNHYYAFADECSHDYAPISTGHIDGDEVVCPRHGARFSIKTGEVKAPPAVVGIDIYEVKIDGNDVFVLLD